MYFNEVFVNSKVFNIVKKDDLDLFIDSCKKVDDMNMMYYKDNFVVVGFLYGKKLMVDLKEVEKNG